MEYKETEMKPTKRHHLTIEELRAYQGCENLSDEQATDILNGLRELSILLCYMMKNKSKLKTHIVDNQHNNIIIFEPNKENKKAA